MPEQPRRQRLYCSPRCRRLAEYDRRRVQRAAERRAWAEAFGLAFADAIDKQQNKEAGA